MGKVYTEEEMKANNLSISIPNKGCDKNCPYCVSRMTGYMKADENLFQINMIKAIHLANIFDVSSISITGKGEPMLNLDAIQNVLSMFKSFPIELQTNGLMLADDTSLVDMLARSGVDIFALSMDDLSDFEDMKYVIERINYMNRTVRVTMNVSDTLPSPEKFKFIDYINKCKEYEVHQFSFRALTIPTGTPEDNKTAQWIKEHVLFNDYYTKLIHEFQREQNNYYEVTYKWLRTLNYGAQLYDVKGVSFTWFDYCIQDQDSTGDSTGIRSLIYQEDGHMYTTWNSLASRVF